MEKTYDCLSCLNIIIPFKQKIGELQTKYNFPIKYRDYTADGCAKPPISDTIYSECRELRNQICDYLLKTYPIETSDRLLFPHTCPFGIPGGFGSNQHGFNQWYSTGISNAMQSSPHTSPAYEAEVGANLLNQAYIICKSAFDAKNTIQPINQKTTWQEHYAQYQNERYMDMKKNIDNHVKYTKNIEELEIKKMRSQQNIKNIKQFTLKDSDMELRLLNNRNKKIDEQKNKKIHEEKVLKHEKLLYDHELKLCESLTMQYFPEKIIDGVLKSAKWHPAFDIKIIQEVYQIFDNVTAKELIVRAKTISEPKVKELLAQYNIKEKEHMIKKEEERKKLADEYGTKLKKKEKELAEKYEQKQREIEEYYKLREQNMAILLFDQHKN
jgi:hypothetical protein